MNEQSKKFTEPVKTTFAPSGSPWGQLMKPESKVMKPTPAPKPTPNPKMQKQAKQPVKPAGKPSQPSKPKLSAAQASARIDPENLVVTDMPFPGRTVSLVSKYAAKFATLPVNHRLVCESQDAPAISTSLKQWAEKNKPGHVARHVRDCGDGMGGVWLLKAEK